MVRDCFALGLQVGMTRGQASQPSATLMWQGGRLGGHSFRGCECGLQMADGCTVVELF